jgi:hypothetical protein
LDGPTIGSIHSHATSWQENPGRKKKRNMGFRKFIEEIKEGTREYKPVSDYVTKIGNSWKCTNLNTNETEDGRKLLCEFAMRVVRDYGVAL